MNNKVRFPSLAGAIITAFAAWSGPVSPQPESITLGAAAFESATATFKLTGEATADADAVNSLKEGVNVSANGTIEIIIGEKGDDAVAAYSAKIPAEAQGYYLSVTPTKVIIAGADNEGTFYGVQSFLQLAEQPQVAETEVTDKPYLAIRGVIEGFYGNPWSHENRIDMFRFMGRHKMNEYTYGPKNDVYHRSNWATPYPAEEGALITELVNEAAKNKVKFVWAMHPSNQIGEEFYQKAIDKFEAMYNLGVRNFSLFFDDIGGESVTQQVAYLQYLTDNFVKKHSDVGPLSVCPTAYNNQMGGAGTESYLQTMSALDTDVKVMWTGRSVVDMLQTENLQWFTEKCGRKPYIWLNYPVNDYGGRSLLMGSVTGLDPNIKDHVSAFCSNPMEYAQASKVALYGLADFAWNPTAFDPQAAWEGATAELMPADAVSAFRRFCLAHVDYNESSHGYRRADETPEFQALNAEKGDLTGANAADYLAYFNAQLEAAKTLQEVESNLLLTEINLWLEEYRLQAERAISLCRIAEILEGENPADFIEEYGNYTELTTRAKSLVDRDFQGTIKTFNPHSGTRYVEPFMTAAIGRLVNAFKDMDIDYPEDLFPDQLVPDGNYYILYNGKYLSNGSGASANTPDNPTWRSSLDNINPNRQVWQIRIDVNNGRYTITSAHDDRYVNEIGNFGVNAYDSNWNTYILSGLNGKYAIKNAGSAGNAYWKPTSTRINKGTSDAYDVDNFLFELRPVNGEAAPEASVTLPGTFLILNDEGLAMTKSSTGPKFTAVGETPKKTQQFLIDVDETTNRFSIVCLSGNSPLDEKVTFRSKSDYAPEWHTYEILERNGKHSIQNCVHVGNNNNTNYWIIDADGNVTTSSEVSPLNAYHFTLKALETEDSAIGEIEATAPAANGIYDLQGRRLESISRPGLYIVNGKVVKY